MSLKMCSFASGSSGNCCLVFSETTGVLVDAGISAKRVWQGLDTLQFPVERLQGLLVTHEHSDHVRCLDPVAGKKRDLPIFANELTWQALNSRTLPERRQTFTKGRPFSIGDIEIEAFGLSHDAADPVGFSFYCQGRQISLMTDTGCVPQGLPDSVKEADTLILEANHDVNLLRIGRYPWFLKQRILGDTGHLSNETAALWLADLISQAPRQRTILLAHLSNENNFPELAWQTVKNILEDKGHYVGNRLQLETLVRNAISPTY